MLMTSFERSLPMMLYRALDGVLPAFRTVFAKVGLTEQQWRILRVLWEHDGATVAELASATLISAPSLVGVVDRLQSASLVKREPSQRDRRQVHVHLTAAGRALEKKVRPQVNQAYARLEAAMTPAQWRALYSGLDRLAELRVAVEAGPAERRSPRGPTAVRVREAAAAARRRAS